MVAGCTSTIGIIGGMGPAATNRLCALITEKTPAAGDHEHIPVITYNNPNIASRVDNILFGGDDPAPELIRTAQVLELAGADFLLMPCNSAHHYIHVLSQHVNIPVVDMIALTVAALQERHGDARRIGILASTPTLYCKMFAAPLAQRGLTLIEPDEESQSRIMDAIHSKDGIKGGFKRGPRTILTGAGSELMTRGAQVIIAGCTEVSLVLTSKTAPFPLVDPLELLADEAVGLALSGFKAQRTQTPQEGIDVSLVYHQGVAATP
jgi:aspartate racemase